MDNKMNDNRSIDEDININAERNDNAENNSTATQNPDTNTVDYTETTNSGDSQRTQNSEQTDSVYFGNTFEQPKQNGNGQGFGNGDFNGQYSGQYGGQYGANGNYAQGNPNLYDNSNDKKGFGIASMILGLISVVVCCCVDFVPAILGALAIVFAAIRMKVKPDGFSIAGLVTGIVGLLANVTLMIIAYSGIIDWSEFESMFESFQIIVKTLSLIR